jgi:hypothetical protein
LADNACCCRAGAVRFLPVRDAVDGWVLGANLAAGRLSAETGGFAGW